MSDHPSGKNPDTPPAAGKRPRRRVEGRLRDAEATRALILEAAEPVLVARGFADTSISDIAKAARVTKSLIHHHFGSKEGLWDAVKNVRFERYAAVQRRMLEESGPEPELLRRSMEAYFRFLGGNPEFVRFMCWMHLEEPEHARFPPADTLTMAGVEKIRETQAAGKLRSDIHPYSILTAFLALAEHWYQTCSRRRMMNMPGGQPSDEQYLEDVVKLFFEGILPRTGADQQTGETASISSDASTSPVATTPASDQPGAPAR